VSVLDKPVAEKILALFKYDQTEPKKQIEFYVQMLGNSGGMFLLPKKIELT
jgi:hypothetical protein